MIGADGIRAILAQYEKYGWQLRRVLLSSWLRTSLGEEIVSLFASGDVIESDIDAAWFSRPSRGKSVAWELRHLNEFPFALLDVVDPNIDDKDLANVLEQTEDRLRERINSRKKGH
jgi:hypothetical protein